MAEFAFLNLILYLCNYSCCHWLYYYSPTSLSLPWFYFFSLLPHTQIPPTSLKDICKSQNAACHHCIVCRKTNSRNTVSPVSEPAAFEEDVTATNCLYLTWLCTPVREREEETERGSNKETSSLQSIRQWSGLVVSSWAQTSSLVSRQGKAFQGKSYCCRSNLHVWFGDHLSWETADLRKAHAHISARSAQCEIQIETDRDGDSSSAWLPFTNSIRSNLIKRLWCSSDIRYDIHSPSVRLSQTHELLSLRCLARAIIRKLL